MVPTPRHMLHATSRRLGRRLSPEQIRGVRSIFISLDGRSCTKWNRLEGRRKASPDDEYRLDKAKARNAFTREMSSRWSGSGPGPAANSGPDRETFARLVMCRDSVRGRSGHLCLCERHRGRRGHGELAWERRSSLRCAGRRHGSRSHAGREAGETSHARCNYTGARIAAHLKGSCSSSVTGFTAGSLTYATAREPVYGVPLSVAYPGQLAGAAP